MPSNPPKHLADLLSHVAIAGSIATLARHSELFEVFADDTAQAFATVLGQPPVTPAERRVRARKRAVLLELHAAKRREERLRLLAIALAVRLELERVAIR
jgi:hypothetical protein